eukprot:scaffold3416_cov133-Isochrysis_galbana.AAC.5
MRMVVGGRRRKKKRRRDEMLQPRGLDRGRRCVGGRRCARHASRCRKKAVMRTPPRRLGI